MNRKLMYTGNYKKMETNFLPCFISFLHSATLSEGRPLCYRMTHCFIDFRWRRPVDIPGWQPYIAVPSVKGRAFNWLQVHQNTHHLFKCWTEGHRFIVPLYSQRHSHSYTKDCIAFCWDLIIAWHCTLHNKTKYLTSIVIEGWLICFHTA